jgi:hypothetical protein
MYDLKKIRVESIPRAITKAERYRLLNEPRSAESICRDVLAADPHHVEALKILVLAITDQFPSLDVRKGMRERKEEVETLLGRLPDEYSRRYYSGVMLERWAKGLLGAGYNSTTVLEYFERAMREYEAADELAGADNQDAVLRWNTCVRIIMRNTLVATEDATGYDLDSFSDEVPGR